jgi:hypothetical protein
MNALLGLIFSNYSKTSQPTRIKARFPHPTLMPWTTIEIGNVDIFSPSLPSFVVYTWYVDDEPES